MSFQQRDFGRVASTGALQQGLSERGTSAGALQLFQNIMSFLLQSTEIFVYIVERQEKEDKRKQ